MPAELRADHVWLADEAEAGRLYNKGAHGLPQSGGALRLDLLEAAHLVEDRKLEVRDPRGREVPLAALLALGSRLDAAFETRWLAYRDLRKRGYIVKAGEEQDFHLYPRGGFPGRTPASHRVLAVGERGTFDLERLGRAAEHEQRFAKGLLLAIVDEEGDITYYGASSLQPRGAIPPRTRDLKGVRAHVLRDRAVLWDAATAGALHDEEFLGKRLGDALQLSLVEALWLAQEHGLGLEDAASGRALEPRDLEERGAALQRDFPLRAAAYRALRSRGLVVKTGFKYGTHFRAYADDPGKAHAEWLVHALPQGFTCPWPDVAGVVRVAHSVRKTLLFVSGERVLALERARP